MDYEELSKVYYRASEDEREAVLAQELASRRDAPSSFIIDYETENGQLFIVVPRGMTTMMERVLRRERKITKLIQQLPGIAGDEVLRSLVFDEVISSNAIENIRSTRRQIEAALRTAAHSKEKHRFREFARLYLDMTFSSPALPRTPEDIRTIYDQVMDGEKLDDLPDGEVFRRDIVYITDGMKQVHAGLYPESKIIEAMEKMLEVAYTDEMPSVYGALAAHYIFEYAHPFYDGNGRTGRYLLSLFLENSLSKPTVLSLSRAIANNRSAYYDAFRVTEKPLNHAELTFFVFTMLQLIMGAQDELINRLEHGNKRYARIAEVCERIEGEFGFADKELVLVFGLAQQAEFGMFKDAPLSLLSDHLGLGAQQTRKYLSKLEEAGVVEKVRGRDPITFALTDTFLKNYFEEDDEEDADAH